MTRHGTAAFASSSLSATPATTWRPVLAHRRVATLREPTVCCLPTLHTDPAGQIQGSSNTMRRDVGRDIGVRGNLGPFAAPRRTRRATSDMANAPRAWHGRRCMCFSREAASDGRWIAAAVYGHGNPTRQATEVGWWGMVWDAVERQPPNERQIRGVPTGLLWRSTFRYRSVMAIEKRHPRSRNDADFTQRHGICHRSRRMASRCPSGGVHIVTVPRRHSRDGPWVSQEPSRRPSARTAPLSAVRGTTRFPVEPRPRLLLDTATCDPVAVHAARRCRGQGRCHMGC